MKTDPETRPSDADASYGIRIGEVRILSHAGDDQRRRLSPPVM
jgi:hypothetical protein